MGRTSIGERTSWGAAPNDEGSGARRNSVQSGMQSTEATAPTEDPDPDGGDDRDLKDSDMSSASGKIDSPYDRKGLCPRLQWDLTDARVGAEDSLVFAASTGIDESYRAQKLMERLHEWSSMARHGVLGSAGIQTSKRGGAPCWHISGRS